MIKDLQEKFSHITYLDSKHQYFSNNKELQSVTKFLSTLKPKFNADFWTVIKAYEFSGYTVKSSWNNFRSFRFIELDGSERIIYLEDDHSHLTVTPEDVKEQWNLDSTIGTTRGSYIHDYLERLENRILDVPPTILPSGMNTAQTVNYVNSLNLAKNLCQDFVDYSKKNLILIVAEFAVGCEKLGLAGRFDRLYWNRETEKYEIWDFKTDKQIRYKSSFGKLNLFDLPDCEYEKYSLQTSLYRKIIQDYLDIELGESRVVWFNLKENKWEILVCKNYVQLITEKLNK